MIEDQHEPGSRGRVLKNLLGIKSKREMDRIEAEAQLRALEEITKTYGATHCFNAQDICRIHKIWLGDIYPWAGQYRSVNILKGDFALEYIAAIHEGLKQNYAPMAKIFLSVMKRTLKNAPGNV